MKSTDPIQRLHDIRIQILGLKAEAYSVIDRLRVDFESTAVVENSAPEPRRRGPKPGKTAQAPRAARKARSPKATATAAPADQTPAAPAPAPTPAEAPAPAAELPPPLPAQATPPTPSPAVSYELKTNQNGQFHFNLKAGNGEVILSSQTYQDKASALAGIESVRANGPDEPNFERKDSTAGEPYFVLKAQNGQVIGNSQMYSSPAARDHGIASVQKNAPSPGLNDLTA